MSKVIGKTEEDLTITFIIEEENHYTLLTHLKPSKTDSKLIVLEERTAFSNDIVRLTNSAIHQNKEWNERITNWVKEVEHK